MFKASDLLNLPGQAQEEVVKSSHPPRCQRILVWVVWVPFLFASWKGTLQAEMLQGYA